jgi:hypothetical protein
VYKILHVADGYLPVENLTACGIYDIKYHCKICLPIENSVYKYKEMAQLYDIILDLFANELTDQSIKIKKIKNIID